MFIGIIIIIIIIIIIQAINVIVITIVITLLPWSMRLPSHGSGQECLLRCWDQHYWSSRGVHLQQSDIDLVIGKRHAISEKF